MRWIIYYGITVALNVVFALFFREHLNITLISAVPIFLMALSIFQAIYFANNRGKGNFSTSYGSELTEEEWAQISSYMTSSFFACIPHFVPFVLFFSTFAKCLSVLIFLAAFVSASMRYRIRHGADMRARLEQEAKDLTEQKNREELGKWK